MQIDEHKSDDKKTITMPAGSHCISSEISIKQTIFSFWAEVIT